MSYTPDLPAADVDRRLRAAVHALGDAEHNVVVWFAEMRRRRLYCDLGYASMRQYARLALGFSTTRAADFDRLAARLDQLPRIRASVASGELGYTKARELIRVASADSEERWLEEAATASRRELERKVQGVQRRARARRKGQAELDDAELFTGDGPGSPGHGEPSDPVTGAAACDDDEFAAVVPTSVSLRFTTEQLARYDALWRRLQAAPNADDMLEALAALVEERGLSGGGETTTSAANRGDHGTSAAGARGTPPVQIHVHACPSCGIMEAEGRLLDRADRERLHCDAAIAEPGRRNITTVPPRTRREVLARDRHRCRAPGCDHRRFLEVHHVVPRARGGTNDPENLITLCSACHRVWHEQGRPAWALALGWCDPGSAVVRDRADQQPLAVTSPRTPAATGASCGPGDPRGSSVPRPRAP